MNTARPTPMGASYRLTSRCVGRQFLLTPTLEVNNDIGYCIGVALNRYGLEIHSLSAMSNHLHTDVTDPFGCVSDYRRDFKALLSRSLNCHYDRSESLWSSGGSGRTLVTSREAAVEGMAYTICNPIEAGLVASPEAWPGLTTLTSDLGATEAECRTFTFHKPSFFFRHEEDGGLPETVTFTLTPHPLGADDPERFLAQLKARVDAKIERKRAEVRGEGGSFAGSAKVTSHHWRDTPETEEERRQLSPRFAEPDPERRVQLLLGYRAWQAEYKSSLAQWRDTGVATFPPGTNKMKDYPGVAIREGPSFF